MTKLTFWVTVNTYGPYMHVKQRTAEEQTKMSMEMMLQLSKWHRKIIPSNKTCSYQCTWGILLLYTNFASLFPVSISLHGYGFATEVALLVLNFKPLKLVSYPEESGNFYKITNEASQKDWITLCSTLLPAGRLLRPGCSFSHTSASIRSVNQISGKAWMWL